MTEIETRAQVLAVVKKTLAADCACDERAFDLDGSTLVTASELPGRRRFRRTSNPLIVTMGRGVVVSASDDRLDWLREHLEPLGRDEVFSAELIGRLLGFAHRHGQTVHGPDLKYTCAPRDLHLDERGGPPIVTYEGQAVLDLYRHEGFSNALQYDADHPQPDVLATVATIDGQVVGIAGASADSDELWQIGVDVLPSARGARLGQSLVSRLTRAIFEQGRVPYYSTSPSNIASRRLARGVGFWPAWTELRIVDRDA